MSDPASFGVQLESGASDWQIVQQNDHGDADLRLTGRWAVKTGQVFRKATVHARIVDENRFEAIRADLDWSAARTRPDGTWSINLKKLPRGGLYRLETCLRLDDAPIEWAIRGDMVHHLGVGDIWVIAGQSNAAGYGKSPADDGPEIGVHLFSARGRWQLATHPLGDSTETRYPANRENANASHSPWLAFGRQLKQTLGFPIGLIPASLGGSPISMWDRTQDGKLFENMLRYVNDSGGGAKGLVWYQGESDTGLQQRMAYREAFRRFARDLRKSLCRPLLPILTIQLNRCVTPPADAPVHAGWETIRETQRQLARDIPGVTVFSIFDAALSDGIHNNSAGNLVIAGRAAATALGAVYGRGNAWRAPECRSTRQINGHTIELTFEMGAGGRLAYDAAVAPCFPFAVRDAVGQAAVTGYTLTGKNQIRIKLERDVHLPMTVTGAPGANPPHVVPFEIPGFRPMLGFTLAVPEPGGGSSKK